MIRSTTAGRSVLLLTYTEALGFELAAELEGRGIAVWSVARFALDSLRRSGFEEGQDFGRYEWKFGIQALADGYAGELGGLRRRRR